MQQINQVLESICKKYMNMVIDITDPGYFLLKKKTVPLSPEQAEFIDIYEKTFTLHTSAVAISLPTAIFYYHFYRAKSTNNQKRLKWAKRGMLLFLPPAMAMTIIAWGFQKTNHFEQRLKQIENFYLERRNQDINQISFTYPKNQIL